MPRGIDDAHMLAGEGERLAAVARRAGLDTPVPTCPGWTVARLVGHVGRVHRWTRMALDARGAEPGRTERPPEGPAVLEWYAAGLADLLEAFRRVDPASPAWNFADRPAIAAFWLRRAPLETALHRIDAEIAGGEEPGDVARDLAVAGIDEIFEVFMPRELARREGDEVDVAGSLHLHCTDADGEWTVRVVDGRVEVDRSHGKGDVAVRGPASDLLLLLWRRRGPDDGRFQVFGDRTVLDRFLAVSAT